MTYEVVIKRIDYYPDIGNAGFFTHKTTEVERVANASLGIERCKELNKLYGNSEREYICQQDLRD
jgi:hypothetical protein